MLLRLWKSYKIVLIDITTGLADESVEYIESLYDIVDTVNYHAVFSSNRVDLFTNGPGYYI